MLRLEGIIPVRTKDRHLIDRLKILPNHELHLNQTSGRSLVTEFEYQHRIEKKIHCDVWNLLYYIHYKTWPIHRTVFYNIFPTQ